MNGGVSGVQGVTASTFNINQNTSIATDGTGWADFQNSPGDTMSFSVDAGGLIPGKTVYAFVRLRTVVDSLGGDLQLSAATMFSGSTPLFGALRYRAAVLADPADCDDAGFGTGSYIVGDAGTEHPLSDAATSIFTLDAASSSAAGAEKTVCFALTLPYPQSNTALQGTTTTPVWQFTANSI